GAALAVLERHGGPVQTLAWSPAGEVLASGARDGNVFLWPDLQARHALSLVGDGAPVMSVAFDETGARLVSAAGDGAAKVWSVADGTLLATLRGHRNTLWGARFIGDRIVTISGDGTARVWVLDDEPWSLVLTGHDDVILDLAVSPNQHDFFTSSTDGMAYIWHLEQLRFSNGELRAALDRATLYCLEPGERSRELGESQLEAERAWASCGQDHGRSSPPLSRVALRGSGGE
ncbi:MAG: hypothetical protein KC431_22710, partial [Myxococcales bacterium]|nr:hypothetical protein [Myxococcales bacterium]